MTRQTHRCGGTVAAIVARTRRPRGVAFGGVVLSRLVALLFPTQVQVFLRNEEEAENVADGRPLLTTEYDVFACDAFALDKGRWLRLVPDAEYAPT